MSRFFSRKYASLVPYTPGEQPKDRQFIKLNTNESPFPPSPIAQRLARQAAGDLRLYSDPECRDLTAVAADVLGLTPEELLFTNGSDEILNFAFMAFCDQNTPAAFADITYGFYKVAADLNAVPYTEIPLAPDFTLRPEDYLGLGKTIFIANPNAPTGIALPAADVERIVAANPGNVVVVDEAYVDFGGESVLPLIRKYDNLLVCRTFSKSYSLAGARLGFGAACPALIRDLNALKYSTNPYNINRMTAAAGIGALTDQTYFRNNCRTVACTRERTEAALREFGFTFTPSSTNFIFAARERVSGAELYASLREHGILVRHFETGRLKNYNRITVGSDEEMDAFLAAVRDILEEKK